VEADPRIFQRGQWRRNEFESGGGGQWPGAKVGAAIRHKVPGIFFGRAPPLFLALKVQLVVRFGECFRDDQYSLASFLYAVLLLMVPPCPAIC